ncbi:MAG: hypothetical protein HZR80_12425 [Candidatus Heimdallarchaeota archaeon]
MRILEEIEITLDDNEIFHLLRADNKSRKNSKKPSTDLLNEISEMKEASLDLIQPKGVYDCFESHKLNPRFLFEKSEKTILAICTIGESLEKRCSKFLQEGELAKGVILDAIASHATEETASSFNKLILNDLTEEVENKEVTNRFSPGYCQWILEVGQSLIFSLLPAETINVSLSASMMMIPRKSVSFAVNFGDKVDNELGIRVCETCNLVNCAHRRV